jgi:hypothetical protein
MPRPEYWLVGSVAATRLRRSRTALRLVENTAAESPRDNAERVGPNVDGCHQGMFLRRRLYTGPRPKALRGVSHGGERRRDGGLTPSNLRRTDSGRTDNDWLHDIVPPVSEHS